MNLKIEASQDGEKVLLDGEDVSRKMEGFTLRREGNGKYVFEPKYAIETVFGNVNDQIDLEKECEKCWARKQMDDERAKKLQRITIAAVSLEAIAAAALVLLLITR